MLRKWPFHTILLALYPVLALLGANVSQVEVSDTLRSFAAALLLAVLLLFLARLLLGDWSKAALLASVTLALFFSYGHVYSLLQGVSLGPIRVGRSAFLLPLWALIFLGVAVWLFRRQRGLEGTQYLNLIAVVLAALPLYGVAGYYLRAGMARNAQKAEQPAALTARFSGKPPDVYYIVLDMHARTDVLKAFYDYDNTWFIEALRARGFYIAEESTSNYSSTLQSISSALNMEYVNYLEDQYGADSNNREPLGLLLEQNRVFQLFQHAGYQIGAFQTDDFYTEFRDLDHYLRPSRREVREYQNAWTLNPFEALLVHSTALRLLYDTGLAGESSLQAKTLETPYDLHRLTVLYALEHLPDFARMDGSYFVFAHIVSPHPPYVFDREGGRLAHHLPYSLAAPGRQDGGAQIVKMYADQVDFIDHEVLQTIDRILARSDTPPIILLQGDHGPVSYSGEDEVRRSNMWEQHAILNAYYFPNEDYSRLYPSITPVNSFRVLFNTFFDGSYERLPDENFFLQHARPYDFVDVTGRVKSDPRTP